MKQILALTVLLFTFSVFADDQRAIVDALRKDDVDAFKSLIPKSEESLMERSDDSIDIIGYAISMKAHKIFEELVTSYPLYVESNAVNALTVACASNRKNIEVIEAILELKVDINIKNNSGTNCLYSAVISADPEFFNYLISKGASPKVEVVPDEVFGYSGPVSIELFLKNRLNNYQEMENRITNQPSAH